MIIYPAIDLKEGKVVRLKQGLFDQVTEYSHTPVSIANHWVDKGAQWLHVVDLDGALKGVSHNLTIVQEIAREVNIPVQMGGGIRTLEDIDLILTSGISRVILGTKAVQDKNFLKEALSKWKDKIAVSLDCSSGFITMKGWTHTSDLRGIEYVKDLEAIGLKNLIYTDIAQDGMMSGPNYTAISELMSVSQIPLIVSGGITTLQDVKTIKRMSARGISGAIIGKALYEGKIDLAEAIKAAT